MPISMYFRVPRVVGKIPKGIPDVSGARARGRGGSAIKFAYSPHSHHSWVSALGEKKMPVLQAWMPAWMLKKGVFSPGLLYPYGN